MTYEEMQKTMQFIVEQQAQFTVDIQQLKESQAKTEEKVSQLTANVRQVSANVGQVSANVSLMSENVGQMSEVVSQMSEVVNRLAGTTVVGFKDVNAKIDAVVDAQMRNEENIKKLTAVVDRYFRERNGQTGSE